MSTKAEQVETSLITTITHKTETDAEFDGYTRAQMRAMVQDHLASASTATRVIAALIDDGKIVAKSKVGSAWTYGLPMEESAPAQPEAAAPAESPVEEPEVAEEPEPIETATEATEEEWIALEESAPAQPAAKTPTERPGASHDRRSAGVKASWTDPRIHAERSARHRIGVRTAGTDAELVEYPSFRKAVDGVALELSRSHVRSFRRECVVNGMIKIGPLEFHCLT